MGAFDPSAREIYTESQLLQYYKQISLPQKYIDRLTTSAKEVTASSTEGLTILAALQRYQLASVPFESLELHYSPHHTISIEPQHLFEKIVARNAGRGGYCMENSCLLGTVLRSIGYEVFSVGARVNEAAQPMAASKNWKGPKYDGWNHMLNIVTIAGARYVVDVGFGSRGPMAPLPLVADSQIHPHVIGQSMRLVRENIPDLTCASQSQQLWIYQHRFSDADTWLSAYCFSETEFTPSDFEMMNYFMSTSRKSWFTFIVVCVKMILDEEGEGVIGDVTLAGTEVKKRVKGESELLVNCTSEKERVEALEKWFGVRLSEAEKRGVQGRITDLL